MIDGSREIHRIFDAELTGEIDASIPQRTLTEHDEPCPGFLEVDPSECQKSQQRSLLFNEPSERQKERRSLVRSRTIESIDIDATRIEKNSFGRASKTGQLANHVLRDRNHLESRREKTLISILQFGYGLQPIRIVAVEVDHQRCPCGRAGIHDRDSSRTVLREDHFGASSAQKTREYPRVAPVGETPTNRTMSPLVFHPPDDSKHGGYRSRST
jgi:hypothetical protein